MDLHDVIGVSGAAMIVIAYALLQLERLSSESLAYSVANALGAALILASLTVEFNLAAFTIEAFWLIISLFGVLKFAQRRRRQRS